MRTRWEKTSGLAPLGRSEQSKIVQNQLVWTGPKAWLDLPVANPAPGQKGNLQFDPGQETQSQQFLGYACELQSGGRAVFYGNASLFDDRLLDAANGDRDLALNTVDWLAQREQYIAIAARPFDEVRVDLTPTESTTILIYVVFGVPGLALLLGVAVWWMRRT
jgi:hypothetical protein